MSQVLCSGFCSYQIVSSGFVNEINLLSQLQGDDRIIMLYDHEEVVTEEEDILYVVMEKGDTDLAILIKNYTTREGAGLKTPSGSLCKLLFVCEMAMRRNANNLHHPRMIDHLTVHVLSKLSTMAIFSELAQTHSLETCRGADNDYLSLIRLVCKKFFTLRMKKIAKDEAVDRSHGNSIDRLRIFSGL